MSHVTSNCQLTSISVQSFSPATNTSFGEGPKNRDAFEEASVVLAQSTIPGSGDGLFAVRDTEKVP